MRIDIITLFPEMLSSMLDESIVARARKKGHLQICYHQLREYATLPNRKVDDELFGGGKGMLLLAEPIAKCIETITEHLGRRPHSIYMSPQGKVLTQAVAKHLAKEENILILCGHYEGVDRRLIDTFIDEEISIGDFVLTGGEIPAVVLSDCVSRMLPGVLSDEACFTDESHFSGLLEYPQYTRPQIWRGVEAPPVLFTGHHKNIETWRREMSLKVTCENRPDLLKKQN